MGVDQTSHPLGPPPRPAHGVPSPVGPAAVFDLRADGRYRRPLSERRSRDLSLWLGRRRAAAGCDGQATHRTPVFVGGPFKAACTAGLKACTTTAAFRTRR